MNEYLSKINQQYLALALLGLVFTTALLGAIWPVWSANAAYDAHIDQVQKQLRVLRKNAVADEKLRPRLEQLQKSQLRNGHYLKGGTEAVAAAELQRVAKRIAGRSNTQLLSTQILPSGEEEGFVRVALKVRMRGDLSGIVEAIYGFESNSTYLFMDNVSIRRGSRRRSTGPKAAEQFDSDFELIGYMLEQHNEI